MEILLNSVALLGIVPGAAFVPGLVLGMWVWRRWAGLGRGRRLIAGGAVVVWLVYGAYETRMYFWMRTVSAPIRVDLLLIAPILLVTTLAAILACMGRRHRAP